MLFSRSDSDAGSSDKNFVGSLYDRYAPWLLAVCMRYTGNREDAQDVLQEGFIKIINGINSFKPTGSIKSWMRKIMVNTALNYIRDHEKEKIFTDLDPAYNLVQNDDGLGETQFPKDLLMGLVTSLPAGYRIVFNLYVMEECSHKEIAEMLGISENTSRSQLLKARNFLRKRLEEYQNKLDHAEEARPNR
jgi:RNA polymerase sigma-70 factor, ECF subfamily